MRNRDQSPVSFQHRQMVRIAKASLWATVIIGLVSTVVAVAAWKWPKASDSVEQPASGPSPGAGATPHPTGATSWTREVSGRYHTVSTTLRDGTCGVGSIDFDTPSDGGRWTATVGEDLLPGVDLRWRLCRQRPWDVSFDTARNKGSEVSAEEAGDPERCLARAEENSGGGNDNNRWNIDFRDGRLSPAPGTSFCLLTYEGRVAAITLEPPEIPKVGRFMVLVHISVWNRPRRSR